MRAMGQRFRRLYPYLWRHRRALGLGMAFLLATAYMEIRLAVLIGTGIDLVAIDFGFFSDVQRSLLGWFFLLAAGLALAVGVARFWTRRLIIGASRHIEFDLRNDLFDHLLAMSPSFYDRYRTGEIMSRATADLDAIRIVIGPAIMYLGNTIAVTPLALGQMLRISPLLTALVWLPLAVIAPLFYFFKARIYRRFRRVQELMGDLTTNVQETLAGIRVIKAYAREEDRDRLFGELSDRYVAANVRLARLQAVFIPMLLLLGGLAMLVLVWAGSWLIIRGRLTIGELTSFFLLLNWSIWPLIALGWVLTQIERGSASMGRIDEIFGQRPEIHPATETDGGNGVDGAGALGIEVRDLSFAYPRGEEAALSGVSLSIPAGTTLGLTGPVGCGKSTLARLLARRYNPPPGTILIGGRDVLEWPVARLRARIGIVDQEPFLFSDSIGANIMLGVDGGPRDAAERMRRAAGAARIDEEISALPARYDTLLGERGINLSGGQRQRTALARALARDPSLLILDDALAAVDAQTEEAILGSLRELLTGRTTVIISHRISTVALADKIAFMEGGRVVEQGTHQELLARRGHYWRLAQRQRLADEIERI